MTSHPPGCGCSGFVGICAERPEQKPITSVVEIIDHGQDGTSGLVPNDVRVNGQSVLMSDRRPVTVHELEVPANDLVEVTLTLIARRVVIGGEQA